MKSKDVQKIVITKYEKSDGPAKIFRDLVRGPSLPTINRWCKMLRDKGSINRFYSPGRPRTARTKGAIQKVKNRLKQKKRLSCRKLANELHISRTSAHRILKNNLSPRAHEKRVEPLLIN